MIEQLLQKWKPVLRKRLRQNKELERFTAANAKVKTALARESTTKSSVLSVENLSKQYGKNTVLSAINFSVAAGEVVAVLGENGAGKSTLSSLIAGLVQPSSGQMIWQGQRYAPRNPNEALHAGISLIHQEIRLLPELSIAENMLIGHFPMCRLAGWGWKIDRRKMLALARFYTEKLGLKIPVETAVKHLKVADCQKIEIAKTLSRGARFFLLDEPTASLGLNDTQLLFKQIRQLKAEGVSFIYVSHRLEEIAQIARSGQTWGTYGAMGKKYPDATRRNGCRCGRFGDVSRK